MWLLRSYIYVLWVSVFVHGTQSICHFCFARTCFAKSKIYKASVKRAALTVEHRLPWFLLNFARDDLFQQSRLLPVAPKISSKGNTPAAVSSWAERRWRAPPEFLSEIDLFVMRFDLLCSVLWWFFMAGALYSGKLRFLHLQTYFIDCGVCAGVIHKQVLVLV